MMLTWKCIYEKVGAAKAGSGWACPGEGAEDNGALMSDVG